MAMLHHNFVPRNREASQNLNPGFAPDGPWLLGFAGIGTAWRFWEQAH
jgi:hypothetical protein